MSSYWTTLRKKENIENVKRKHQIAPCGELAVEEAVHLSCDRLRIEWVNKRSLRLK